MKKLLIGLVIIVMLLGVIILFTSSGEMPDTLSVEGIVTETNQTELVLSSGDGDDGMYSFALNPETVITNAVGETVDPTYIRNGFSASVQAHLVDEAYTADTVTITEEPNVLLFDLDAGDAVSDPLTITGEARLWYFEASFPVDLVAPNGEVVAQAPAQAQGDWMTEDYVPFEVTLEWDQELAGEGSVVFHKSNASGLPEHDASVSVPVVFTGNTNGAEETMTVNVFFTYAPPGENITDCTDVVAVERSIPRTQAVAEAAINELLQGPTSAEQADNYVTNIPEGTELQSIRIEDGTAYVDFNAALDENIGGSCLVQAIYAQIEETLTQFPTVDNAIISRNGSVDDVLQP